MREGQVNCSLLLGRCQIHHRRLLSRWGLCCCCWLLSRWCFFHWCLLSCSWLCSTLQLRFKKSDILCINNFKTEYEQFKKKSHFMYKTENVDSKLIDQASVPHDKAHFHLSCNPTAWVKNSVSGLTPCQYYSISVLIPGHLAQLLEYMSVLLQITWMFVLIPGQTMSVLLMWYSGYVIMSYNLSVLDKIIRNIEIWNSLSMHSIFCFYYKIKTRHLAFISLYF